MHTTHYLSQRRSPRIVAALFVVALLLPAIYLNARAAAPPSGLRMARSDAHGLLLSMAAPSYQASPTQPGQDGPLQLSVAGATPSAEPGRPALPTFVALLGVPPGARLALRTLSADTVTVEGPLSLALAAQPAPLSADLAPGALGPAAPIADSACYPAAPAQIVEEAWLRDQRIVRVALYPLQYCAAEGRLRWHRQLQVELTWDTPAASLAVTPSGPADSFAEQALRQSLLNYADARAWRSAPPRQAAIAQAEDLAARYRIGVDHDGLYRISAAALQAAGMDLATSDPRSFRLSSQGHPVAITVSGEADGRLDASDSLTFYGQRLSAAPISDTIILSGTLVTTDTVVSRNYSTPTEYTDENVYWLDVGGEPGPRIAEQSAAPQGGPTPPSYRASARAEAENEWWTWHFTSRDPWFWQRLTSSSPLSATFAVALSAIAEGGQASVRGELVARAASQGAGPDHRTRAALNGELVEDASWSGRTRHQFANSLAQAALREGSNELTLAMFPQPSLGVDDIYFDWFAVEYDRRFVAEGNQLAFDYGIAGSWQYTISGFSDSAASAYDITSPTSPRLLTGVATLADGPAYRVSFEVAQPAAASYIVASPSAIEPPLSIRRYVPAGLRSATHGADYIIITHRDFSATAQSLADYRATQGFRTAVVDIDDLYNEFNEGIYNPVAIKRFLAYAYASWQPPAPQYVLLVGDGHWNFKYHNVARFGSAPIYMPPNLAWVDPWQGQVDSSNQLASIVGDDILPDLAIGRLPVNSTAELQAIIDKIIAYEQPSAPSDWQRRLVFVADNTPDSAGDFIASSENVISAAVPQAAQVSRAYLNDLCGPPGNPPQPCPSATKALTETLNAPGAAVLSYSGHGSLAGWAHEGVLTQSSLPTLNNGAYLPLVLSLTCLDGYWIHPANTGFAEVMLRTAGRGAIASFSATGLGLVNGHDTLQAAFLQAIFRDGARRLGPPSLAARLALYATGSYPDLIDTFTVFGDPALKLSIAEDLLPPEPTPTVPSPEPTSSPQPTDNRRLYVPIMRRPG